MNVVLTKFQKSEMGLKVQKVGNPFLKPKHTIMKISLHLFLRACNGVIQGNIPVFNEVALSGDTEHLGVHKLNRELFCRDCIHFILKTESNVFQILLSRHRAILWKQCPHQQK